MSRFRQVLQHETHEDMVEARLFEGQMEEIAHLEGHVPMTCGFDPALRPLRSRPAKRPPRQCCASGLEAAKQNGLRASPTAAFEDAAAGWVGRVMVQKVAEGIGLIGKPNRFAAGVTVDVTGSWSSRSSLPRDSLGYNEDWQWGRSSAG